MSAPIPTRLIRHPRRLGFIAFNAIAVALTLVWLMTRTENAEVGLAGLPNVAITTAAMIVLVAVWATTWVAWGSMVWARHRRLR